MTKTFDETFVPPGNVKKARKQVAWRRLSLWALAYGNRVILVDAQGRRLTPAFNPQQIIQDPDPAVLKQWIWRKAAYRLQARLYHHNYRPNPDAWSKKVSVLAKSFRLRSYDVGRPRGRCRFEKYATTTWREAAERLWYQIDNRRRLRTRTGWERWAHTVSNNHNKRKGGRYAKEAYCDGHANPESDQGTELSVCD